SAGLQRGIAFQVRVEPGHVNVHTLVLGVESSVESSRIDRGKTDGSCAQGRGKGPGRERATESAVDHAPTGDHGLQRRTRNQIHGVRRYGQTWEAHPHPITSLERVTRPRRRVAVMMTKIKPHCARLHGECA